MNLLVPFSAEGAWLSKEGPAALDQGLGGRAWSLEVCWKVSKFGVQVHVLCSHILNVALSMHVYIYI